MKRILFSGLLVFVFNPGGNAQTQKHSIGIRREQSPAFDKMSNSLTYQLALNQSNRLSFGLGLSGGMNFGGPVSFMGNTSVYYQHVWNIKKGLNWHLGGGINYWLLHSKVGDKMITRQYFGIGPEIGLEYDFNLHSVPLIVGVDYRPTILSGSPIYQPYARSNNFGISCKYTF